MIYNFTNDIDYAKDVCEGLRLAREKFILQITDRAYNTVLKFHNRPEDEDVLYIDSSRKDELQSGKKINSSDSIRDDWVWLLQEMCKLSCKYKGKAPFMNFINHSLSLNNVFTKNDLLKRKYGNTAYIPKIIKNLSEEHQTIFTYMRRGKNINDISKEINIELNDVEYMIHEIKILLFRYGKGNTLADKKIRFMDMACDEKTTDLPDWLEDINSIDPTINADFEKIYMIFMECYNNLNKIDKRFLRLYWHEELSVKQIIKYIKEEGILDDFINTDIHNEKNFNKHLNKIIKDCDDWAIKNHNNLYNSYELNKVKIKNGIKALLNYFKI